MSSIAALGRYLHLRRAQQADTASSSTSTESLPDGVFGRHNSTNLTGNPVPDRSSPGAARDEIFPHVGQSQDDSHAMSLSQVHEEPSSQRVNRRINQQDEYDEHIPSVGHSTRDEVNLRQQEGYNHRRVDSRASVGNSERNLSPSERKRSVFENLKQRHSNCPSNGDSTPRLPKVSDLSPQFSINIVPKVPKEGIGIEHVVILLHHYGGSESAESSLADLAWRLHELQRETAFVLLRGFSSVPIGNSGYHWADSKDDGDFMRASDIILSDVIKSCLVSVCGFAPREIVLMGHGQGGMAALATAALWGGFELGGAISIGGPLPSYIGTVAKTPVLVLGGNLGDLHPSAVQQVQNNFSCVDYKIQGTHDTIPETEEEMKPIIEFIAHRLRREEWEKQAIISFDGGGIRGYGSLLILQDLMNKIGDEEKLLDQEEKRTNTSSSFAPGDYKPIRPKTRHDATTRRSSQSSPSSVDPGQKPAVATSTENLPNSALFLPCHYFTYAAGTSTGGLISIMLSRFRMTVDECILEYKRLGERIFGHPRYLATGAVLWHKFDFRVLEAVIQDVTARHSEESDEYDVQYPLDEDLCRTIVLAYADHIKTDAPYLFRTYHTPPPRADPNKTRLRHATSRNHGPPPTLPIWKVARATSAAPKYFPPIKIQKGSDSDPKNCVKFKDGGFGCNNPSEEAYWDILHKHGGMARNIGPFISIGTGIPPFEMFAEAPGNLPNAVANLKAATKLPSRTMKTHDAMARLSHRDGQDIFPYYRFDGGKRLGEVKLDEWKSHRLTRLTGRDREPGSKTIDKMFSATAVYLQHRDVQRDLTDCAKLLVRRRRLRMRNSSAWDRYASASFYECNYKGCESKRINTKQLFKEHLKQKHHIKIEDEIVEQSIGESRHCWVYRQHTDDSAVSQLEGSNGKKKRKEPTASQVEPASAAGALGGSTHAGHDSGA